MRLRYEISQIILHSADAQLSLFMAEFMALSFAIPTFKRHFSLSSGTEVSNNEIDF